MICKYCGAELSNTAVKCARCKKPTAPMSDCGGFYDLAPNGKRYGAAPSSSTGYGNPSAAPTAAYREPPKSSKRKPGPGYGLLWIMVGVLVVLTVVLFVMVCNANGRIHTLEKLHPELTVATEPPTEPSTEPTESTPPTTEPAVQEASDGLEEGVEYRFSVTYEDTAWYVAKSKDGMELTDTPDEALAVQAQAVIEEEKTIGYKLYCTETEGAKLYIVIEEESKSVEFSDDESKATVYTCENMVAVAAIAEGSYSFGESNGVVAVMEATEQANLCKLQKIEQKAEDDNGNDGTAGEAESGQKTEQTTESTGNASNPSKNSDTTTTGGSDEKTNEQ